MQLLPGATKRTLKGLIVIGSFLLLQKASGYRDDSPTSKDSSDSNYRHKQESRSYPANYRKSEGRDSSAPISNYDFYKPLTRYEDGRNSYPEEKEWRNPTRGDKKWRQRDSYKNEDEAEEEPRYGYKPELRHVSKHKQLDDDDDDDPLMDSKQGYFSDWKYDKHNGWKSHDLKSPFKHNEDDSEEKDLSTKGKHLSYKGVDEYPVDDQNSKTQTWKLHSDKPEVGKVAIYEVQGLPKHKPSEHLDTKNDKKWPGSKGKGEYSNHGHGNLDWNKQKHSNLDNNRYPKKEPAKEDEKDILLIDLKDGWLGRKNLNRNVPEFKHSSYGDKDTFSKGYLYHMKDYSDFIPSFNHGGHSYGWVYRPSKNLHHKYLLDSNRKLRFLQEHQKKLADLQQKHMESYKKFMDEPFQDSKHKSGSYRNPEVDEKPYYSPVLKSHDHSESSEYNVEREVQHHSSLPKYEKPLKTYLNNSPPKFSAPHHLPWYSDLAEGNLRHGDITNLDEEESFQED